MKKLRIILIVIILVWWYILLYDKWWYQNVEKINQIREIENEERDNEIEDNLEKSMNEKVDLVVENLKDKWNVKEVEEISIIEEEEDTKQDEQIELDKEIDVEGDLEISNLQPKIEEDEEHENSNELEEEAEEWSSIITMKWFLENVTNIATIQWVKYEGDEVGNTIYTWDGELFTVDAIFDNLPEVGSHLFYEWRVVRKNPLSVISTDAAKLVKKEDGTMMFVNTRTSDADLTDHTLYVLTLEPDDGDPAPADHIAEGMVINILDS